MKLVKFAKHYRCYNAGEIAAFEDPFADGLVHSGIAALVVDTPAVVKDVPAGVEHSVPEAAGEIEDEDLEAPAKSHGKGKRS
jgi:hypothetical protein